MRMVKSLLLSSAAGLVAVAGAQAADLPVKAKPVEYVKICNLYGDGFYYIPGTETCVRFAGLVWAEVAYGSSANSEQPSYFGQAGAQDRSTTPWVTRSRADFDIDARTQTSYGTLRSFIRFRVDKGTSQPVASVATFSGITGAPTALGNGSNTNNGEGGSTPTAPRAFIQFAGLTIGNTRSLFDNVANFNEFRLLHQMQAGNDTVGGGTNEISYTWELGNGITFNIGAGDRRSQSITNLSVGGIPATPAILDIQNSVVTVGTTPTTFTGGTHAPDPFAALRVSQAWGTAMVGIVAHENAATYYTNVLGVPGYVPSVACVAQPGTNACTGPTEKWGFAVAASTIIQMPMVAPGDRLGLGFQAGVGAMKYAPGGNVNGPGLFGSNNNVAVGVVTDAVFVNGSGLQLTTGWSVNAEFEHWWTPQWNTVWFGSYSQVSYNSTVTTNRWFCGGGGATGQNLNLTAAANAAGNACDPGFNLIQLGATVSFYPIPQLRFALEGLYTGIQTGFNGSPLVLARATGLRAASPTAAYTAKDEGVGQVVFRVQRWFPSGD